MSMFAELLSTFFDRRTAGDVAIDDSQKEMPVLVSELMGIHGELSGMSIAGAILEKFSAFGPDEQLTFFQSLLNELDIDPGAVRTALDALEAKPGMATYQTFAAVAEPPRQEFIRRLNQYPGATAAIVKMRVALRALGKTHPELMAIDVDFRHLLSSWFNRGFLVLRPINWQSPAHILEKIIAYEAVHEIGSWSDLRLRLEPPDRRCYAFFHPSMPDDPLIFVEIALTREVPVSITDLLSKDRDPVMSELSTTAVFYSISNCQDGLAGISFGNSLIKQVASDLSRDMKQLKTFVTISPIPGFVRWLQDSNQMGVGDDALPALAAQYLIAEKRKDGTPIDPVARFHLSNGAEVYRLCAGADPSTNGMDRSRGVMVNYRYDLEAVGRNLEDYAKSRTVKASRTVRALISNK